jgi:hypothetical protein
MISGVTTGRSLQGRMMATTQDDIRAWFKDGQKKKATHMIIVCDTFDHGDFPVYVMPDERVILRAEEERNKPMQKVMEVYKLSDPVEEQVCLPRCFRY